MVIKNPYKKFQEAILLKQKMLAILIDPDKFEVAQTAPFLKTIPSETTHIFIGGSTVANGKTQELVVAIKRHTSLPLFIFPGDYTQISEGADALLFLSLLSGRNAEYLINQQVKAVPYLKEASLEVIPTGYLLIDGGNESSVARVTNTKAMDQSNEQ